MSIPRSMVFAALAALPIAAPAEEGKFQKLFPVPFTSVEIEDGFWSPKLETIRGKTLPHLFRMFEEDGTVANFARAGGLEKGEHRGNPWNDGLFFCALQAASEFLSKRSDPELEKRLDGYIEKIRAAQEKDGYLHTFQELRNPGKRWEYEKGTHELYDAGQLMEAGAAHFQATGKRSLLDAAIRFADLIDSTFGPGKRSIVSDHAEPELALVKLYRLTRDERYLKLSRFLIDEHGREGGRKLLGAYAQDQKPFVDQDRPEGHAVRAMLFYSGAADVAAETGDPGYVKALERIWRSMAERRMYITGGLGSAAQWEGFGEDYDLPNETGYLETCASVGNAYLSHRMNLLLGDARYADVLERVLYNGILVGVSLAGDRFFYENPLASRGGRHRWSWHGCACCPPNLVKFFSSLGSTIYAIDGDGISINLFIGSRAELRWKETGIRLRQETGYPWDGCVKVSVEPERELEFALRLRKPGWCEGLSLRVNGSAVPFPEPRRGYIAIQRRWKKGDVLEADLEMPVRRIHAHPSVKADLGRVALQRGPLIYCIEGADGDGHVFNLALPPGSPLEAVHRPDLLGGVTVIRGTALARGMGDPEGRLYGPEPRAPSLKSVAFTAIPYFAWDNRDPGEMAVWIPECPSLAEPILPVSASHCWEHDSIRGLLNQADPAHSNDQDLPRFSAWPHRGTAEWVERRFEAPREVSRVEVYWYDDSPENNARVGGKIQGQCRPPRAWRLLWRDGESWRPVPGAGSFGVDLNRFNALEFQPVTTGALRIEMDLQKDFTAGILAWRIQ